MDVILRIMRAKELYVHWALC